MTKLPDKPSELIRVAIKDLKKVEKDSNYDVDMSEWHTPVYDAPCHVCLAGAVMAKTLSVSVDAYAEPSTYGAHTGNRLRALDCFRCGDVYDGLYTMDADVSKSPADFNISPYESDPDGFKKNMLNLARRLKRRGL